MKTWLIGATLVALLAASMVLTALKRNNSVSAVPAAPLPEIVEVASRPAPREPIVLPQVVDVTDIDALLDPPAIPRSDSPTVAGPSLIRVGYEEPAAATPQTSPAMPIPKAADDGE